MFESPDDRSAYHAARSLTEVRGQPHEFLVLKQRLLEAPGVVVTSVPRSIAFACQEKLAALGLATQISHQTTRPAVTVEAPAPTQARPGRSILQNIRDRPGTALAAIVGVALISAVVLLGRDDAPLTLDPHVGPISAEQFAELAQGAIVDLSCEDRSGVGFFVEEGIILTAAHIVCPAVPSVDVRFADGRTSQGRVTRVDNLLDLALVRITGSSGRPLLLVDSTSLQSGDSVVMVKRSQDGGSTRSSARITDTNRILLGTSFLQIDDTGSSVDSGEPLFDESGRVVGIVLSQLGSSGRRWLALSSNYLVDGPNAMLPDLHMDIDRFRWEARLQDADDADRKTVARARIGPSQAGVLAARTSSRTSVAVTVARWAASAPSDQQFSFTIRRGENVMCSLSGNANSWRRATDGSVSIPNSSYTMWLERNDLLEENFVSSVLLDTTACDDPSAIPGATVVLHSGAPYADRTTIASR